MRPWDLTGPAAVFVYKAGKTPGFPYLRRCSWFRIFRLLMEIIIGLHYVKRKGLLGACGRLEAGLTSFSRDEGYGNKTTEVFYYGLRLREFK